MFLNTKFVFTIVSKAETFLQNNFIKYSETLCGANMVSTRYFGDLKKLKTLQQACILYTAGKIK